MRTWIIALCISLSLCGAALAKGISIHRMVVGDRALELQDTVQLTAHGDAEAVGAWISPDGKFVVYMDEGESGEERVCLTRSSGGGHSILLDTPKDDKSPGQVWVASPSGSGLECLPAWSPDSRLIAFQATLVTLGGTEDVDYTAAVSYIFVITTAGLVRAQIPLPLLRDIREVERLYWSPDSRRLACVVQRVDRTIPKTVQPMTDLLMLDMANGTVKTVYSKPDADVHVQRWMADSKSLHYAVEDASGWQIMEWHVDGRRDSLVETVKTLEENTSPDGRWKKGDCKGLCVEDCATGETKQVFKDSVVDFVGWTPDGNLVMYTQPFKISDLSGKRSRDLNSVWLAVAEDHKLNHMCIALDMDKYYASSFSRDGMRFAYVCQGRVCLAQLGWTRPDASDKIAAGIPLDEDEEKTYLTNAAKQISAVVGMYASDHDGSYPSDAFVDEMGPYLRTDLFNRPGTDQMAFQYFPLGAEADVSNTTAAVMGMFDVGYQWQIILYADGHVRVVPKTK